MKRVFKFKLCVTNFAHSIVFLAHFSDLISSKRENIFLTMMPSFNLCNYQQNY